MTTRRHTIRFAAVGLAMSGLMALAACGGDDKGDDKQSETTVAASGDDEPTAPDDTTTDDTTAPDESTAPDDSTTETTFDTSDIEALSAEECRDLYAKFVGLGFDPKEDEEPEDPSEVFAALEDAVPDDLKADLAVLREGFEAVTEAQEKYGDDVTNPEYVKVLETLSTPEFAEAGARLEAFFANCETAVAD